MRIYFGIHDGSIEIPPELANSNNSNSKNNTSSNQNKKKGGSAKQQQKQAPPQEKPATKCLTEKPLVAAEKILMPLLKCCSSDVRTWEAHYHLAFRKGSLFSSSTSYFPFLRSLYLLVWFLMLLV